MTPGRNRRGCGLFQMTYAGVMTEDQARAALAAFAAVGDIEQWTAKQPWEPAPGLRGRR
jgi:hypothetical protein